MTEQELIEPKVFQCSLCPFYAAYDRHDSKYIDESIQTTMQNNRNKKDSALTVDLLEKVYLLRDPFIIIKDKNKEDQAKLSSIIIGSTCSVCSRCVCLNPDCSLYYTRRFCLKCLAKYRHEFPQEILDEIGTKRLEKYINEDDEQYDDN